MSGIIVTKVFLHIPTVLKFKQCWAVDDVLDIFRALEVHFDSTWFVFLGMTFKVHLRWEKYVHRTCVITHSVKLVIWGWVSLKQESENQCYPKTACQLGKWQRLLKYLVNLSLVLDTFQKLIQRSYVTNLVSWVCLLSGHQVHSGVIAVSIIIYTHWLWLCVITAVNINTRKIQALGKSLAKHKVCPVINWFVGNICHGMFAINISHAKWFISINND